MSSEYRTKSLNSGFVIKDGPHSVDTKGMIAGVKDVRDTVCKQYQDAKYQYQIGGDISVGSHGKAILTPYSPGSWYVR